MGCSDLLQSSLKATVFVSLLIASASEILKVMWMVITEMVLILKMEFDILSQCLESLSCLLFLTSSLLMMEDLLTLKHSWVYPWKSTYLLLVVYVNISRSRQFSISVGDICLETIFLLPLHILASCNRCTLAL